MKTRAFPATAHPGGTVRQIGALACCIAFTFLASAGAFFTQSGSSPWYVALNKPAWQPAPAVFGPVWTTLYILMAVALWRVWRSPIGSSVRRAALAAFITQWVFNAAWTPLFFGTHQIGLALIDIVALEITLIIGVVLFSRVDRAAGWLLLPTLIWVSFATLLNFVLWRMN